MSVDACRTSLIQRLVVLMELCPDVEIEYVFEATASSRYSTTHLNAYGTSSTGYPQNQPIIYVVGGYHTGGMLYGSWRHEIRFGMLADHNRAYGDSQTIIPTNRPVLTHSRLTIPINIDWFYTPEEPPNLPKTPRDNDYRSIPISKERRGKHDAKYVNMSGRIAASKKNRVHRHHA